MSRILRLAFVGIVLMLTSLVFDVTSVGAKWVRMGQSDSVMAAGSICSNGVWLSGAYTAYNKITNEPIAGGGGNARILNFSSLTPPNLPALREGGYFPIQYARNGIDYVDLERVGSIPVTYHDTRINLGVTGGIGKGGFPDWIIQDYANYYGSIFLPWSITPDFTTYPYIVIMTSDGYVSRISNGFEDCSGANFTDKRVDAYEPWQSVAAYCEDKMVKVYGIDASGNGYFAFAVTQEDISKLGIPTENTLLASFPSAFGGKIRLYKLKDTGELQINAPGLPPDSWKEYVFTWTGCT